MESASHMLEGIRSRLGDAKRLVKGDGEIAPVADAIAYLAEAVGMLTQLVERLGPVEVDDPSAAGGRRYDDPNQMRIREDAAQMAEAERRVGG